MDAEELLTEGIEQIGFSGWFPAFMSGEGIYTWSGAIDRVEVTV